MKFSILLLVSTFTESLGFRAEGLKWARTLVASEATNAGAISAKNDLLTLCKQTPNNGVGAASGRVADVERAATALERLCPPSPTSLKLTGVWDLLYSTAPGGSNGKVGPFIGKVTQEFVDEINFINAVELFGAFKLSLYAKRKVIDGRRIQVTFEQTGVQLFGVEVFRKDINGSGVWSQRYVDDSLRVMNTPSLFVLQRRP